MLPESIPPIVPIGPTTQAEGVVPVAEPFGLAVAQSDVAQVSTVGHGLSAFLSTHWMSCGGSGLSVSRYGAGGPPNDSSGLRGDSNRGDLGGLGDQPAPGVPHVGDFVHAVVGDFGGLHADSHRSGCG